MAISAVGTPVAIGGGTTDSRTFNVVVPGGLDNPTIDIAIYYGDTGSTAASVTVDGDPATFVVRGGVGGVGENEGNNYSSERWFISGVSSGTLEIIVTLASSAENWVSAIVMDAPNPIVVGNTNTKRGDYVVDWGGVVTLDIATEVGDFLVETLSWNGSSAEFSPGSGQTQFYSASDSDVKSAGYQVAVGTTTTCTWDDGPAGVQDGDLTIVAYREESSAAPVELGGEESEAGTESSAGTFLATSVFAFTGVEALSDSLAEGGTFVGTSPAIRVDDVLQDTDSGELIDIESAEVVVLGGTPGSRTIVTQNATFEVADGVVEIPGAYTLDAEYLVALVESSERMSILPATVVDRNA